MATVGKCPAEDPHLGNQAILPTAAVLMEVGAVTDRLPRAVVAVSPAPTFLRRLWLASAVRFVVRRCSFASQVSSSRPCRAAASSSKTPNPAVDPVRFALWTLRDEAAQRRSP